MAARAAGGWAMSAALVLLGIPAALLLSAVVIDVLLFGHGRVRK